MESAGGSVCGPPVEPVITETPSMRNSLLSVRLPLIESCDELNPPWLLMSLPEETPGVRASRFRTLRLGSGRSWTCEGVIVVPKDEVSVASWPWVEPSTVTVSATWPTCSVILMSAR